jgi:hypothetical protein
MKSVFVLISTFLLAGAARGSAVLEPRTQGNYVQKTSGTASFTYYYGCGYPGKPQIGVPPGAHTLNVPSL